MKKDSNLRYTIFLHLEEQKRSNLFSIFELGVINVILDKIIRKQNITQNFLEIEVFPYVPFRRIKGILEDPILSQKIEKRLKVRLIRPKTPKRQQRIRGYRDHGSLSDPSKWLPSSSPQANIKMLHDENLEDYMKALENPDINIRVSCYTKYQQRYEELEKIQQKVDLSLRTSES
jgi:hypothetical protein